MLAGTLDNLSIKMWPWTKANTKNSYKDIILKGFPMSVRQDVEIVFDIIPLGHDIEHRFGQVIKIDNLIHPEREVIKIDNETLEIPSRVYFNEPQAGKENQLTEIQKSIINCIYLRHHNGMVRQKRLHLLIDKNDYFIVPYKFNLLGEYVIEILEDVKKHISTDSIDNFVKFAIENEKYFFRTESKMVSFWNTHYRWKYPRLKEYVGRQNIDEIKKRMHNMNSQKNN